MYNWLLCFLFVWYHANVAAYVSHVEDLTSSQDDTGHFPMGLYLHSGHPVEMLLPFFMVQLHIQAPAELALQPTCLLKLLILQKVFL